MRFPTKTVLWFLIATSPVWAYVGYSVMSSNQLYYNLTVSSGPKIAIGPQPTALFVGDWNNATVSVNTGQTFNAALHLQVYNTTASGENGVNPGSVTVWIDNQLMTPLPGYNAYYITAPKSISNGTTFTYSILYNAAAPYKIRLQLS